MTATAAAPETVKVKLTSARVGNAGAFEAGEVVDWPRYATDEHGQVARDGAGRPIEEAARLIAAGQAKAVK